MAQILERSEGWSEVLFTARAPSICLICCEVQRDAVVVMCCGRSFCNGCFQKMQMCGNCANCSRNGLTWTINHDLRKAIEQSLVVCSTRLDVSGTKLLHGQDVCGWEGALEDLPAHLLECGYVKVSCPFQSEFGCDCPEVLRRFWNAHQGKMASVHAQLASHLLRKATQQSTGMKEVETMTSSSAAAPAAFVAVSRAFCAASAAESCRAWILDNAIIGMSCIFFAADNKGDGIGECEPLLGDAEGSDVWTDSTASFEPPMAPRTAPRNGDLTTDLTAQPQPVRLGCVPAARACVRTL